MALSKMAFDAMKGSSPSKLRAWLHRTIIVATMADIYTQIADFLWHRAAACQSASVGLQETSRGISRCPTLQDNCFCDFIFW